MLLDRARSQLLVVDVQERLLPAVQNGERMVERCAILLKVAQRLAIPVLISEQYKKGLGPTVHQLNDTKGDAVIMEKAHFSCAADPAIMAHVSDITAQGRNQIVVCGAEAHVCVLQSALGLKIKGLDVFVVADAVSSRRDESVDLAMKRLRDVAVGVVNTEMVVFEWLHVSGTEEFKALSKLIK